MKTMDTEILKQFHKRDKNISGSRYIHAQRENSEMESNININYKAIEEVVRRAGMMIKEAHLSRRFGTAQRRSCKFCYFL